MSEKSFISLEDRVLSFLHFLCWYSSDRMTPATETFPWIWRVTVPSFHAISSNSRTLLTQKECILHSSCMPKNQIFKAQTRPYRQSRHPHRITKTTMR